MNPKTAILSVAVVLHIPNALLPTDASTSNELSGVDVPPGVSPLPICGLSPSPFGRGSPPDGISLSNTGMSICTFVPKCSAVGENVGLKLGSTVGCPRPVSFPTSVVGDTVRTKASPLASNPLSAGVGEGDSLELTILALIVIANITNIDSAAIVN